MKKILLYTGIVSVVCIVLSCNNSSTSSAVAEKNSAAINSPYKTPGEDSINLDSCKLNKDSVLINFKRFRSNYTINTKKNDKVDSIRILADSIRNSTLLKLYNIVASIHTTPHYVTGVRIHYGIDSANRFRLIYEPVCLCTATVPEKNKKHTYEIVISGNMFFTYDTAFSLINGSELSADTSNYYSQIRIHGGKFKHDTDVKSIIYPFQELWKAINDNPKSAVLKIGNLVSFKAKDIVKNRHDLVMGPDNLSFNISNEKLTVSFEDAYADLGNMCPPSCSPGFPISAPATGN